MRWFDAHACVCAHAIGAELAEASERIEVALTPVVAFADSHYPLGVVICGLLVACVAADTRWR